MPAVYNGQVFRTQLEATWAAFFDLAGWEWQVQPEPVGNWAPDFRVSFECRHSECGGSHSLLVGVLPLSQIEEFGCHPCLQYPFGFNQTTGNKIPEDAGAAFGLGPNVTHWEMSHGAGGGNEDVSSWVPNARTLWDKAIGRVVSLSPVDNMCGCKSLDLVSGVANAHRRPQKEPQW